jgi:tetratricopeptide (TPR) repeat protein
VPKLPVVDLCEDRVTLPVAGVAESVPAQESPIKPAWQRWNDYGIGCLTEGEPLHSKKGNLKQAEAAFRKLIALGVKDAEWHGHLNLARVLIALGGERRLAEAGRELNAAQSCDPPAPWWLVAWFNGLVTAQNPNNASDLDTAAALFEKIVDPANQPRHDDGRLKYDFTRDYVVLAELGKTLYKRSTLEPPGEARRVFLLRAVKAYERALAVDPEDLDSHFGLNQCYSLLAAGAPGAPVPDGRVSTDRLKELGDAATKQDAPASDRVRAAADLAAAVTAVGKLAPDPANPRLPTLRALHSRLRPAYHDEADPAAKSALAAALANLHLLSHAIYKEDELAPAVRQMHRDKHPAANAAAEAIVMYPTNRPGAPGLKGP